MPRRKLIQIALGFLLVLVLGVGGFLRNQTITHPATGGATMGTGYSIKISGKVKTGDLEKLTARIEERLVELNRQMSTWDPESEISRFNHFRSTEPFACSREFRMVVARSLELAASTGGAFDPTLQPLLNLWGFGSEGVEDRIPSVEKIAAIKAKTGFQKILIEPGGLRKTDPELSLALGAIAKGYGVDALAEILDSAGHAEWFAEIGGEVVVRGLNPEGVPWKVGIQYPTTNPMDERLQGIVHLTNGAVATSGNYRNYIEQDGELFSHILDPRTGEAIHSKTAGVTVFADSCMDADGMATALYVMSVDEGLGWVEGLQGVEAMFLIQDESGEIIEKFSSGFIKATGYTSIR